MESEKKNFDYSEINQEDFDATYSPEDNKLRITASYRFEDALWQDFKKLGFRWAPKQEIFVHPMWRPDVEDFCLKMAGSIEPEEMTMVERAQFKNDRIDGYIANRHRDVNAFTAAADRYGERFAGGQPILVGHHSENQARNDHKRMVRNTEKAHEAAGKIDYWHYKKEGVAIHANRKAAYGVRVRRMKGLFADLRSIQRDINTAQVWRDRWAKVLNKTDHPKFDEFVISQLNFFGSSYSGAWSDVKDGKITALEGAKKALAAQENLLNSSKRRRWITHILNRLGYERAELGPVEKFAGEFTSAILQEFARTHGAHKPKATKTDYGWLVESTTELPLHLTDGCTLEKDADEWRDLFEAVGYEVPDAKPKQPPILNFKVETLTTKLWRDVRTFSQIEMSKAEYKKLNGFITLSLCGQFRFRLGYTGVGYSSERKAVFLTDSKVHPAPESKAIDQPLAEKVSA